MLLFAERRGTKHEGVVSVADWYGTLCNLAGVDMKDNNTTNNNHDNHVNNVDNIDNDTTTTTTTTTTTNDTNDTNVTNTDTSTCKDERSEAANGFLRERGLPLLHRVERANTTINNTT